MRRSMNAEVKSLCAMVAAIAPSLCDCEGLGLVESQPLLYDIY